METSTCPEVAILAEELATAIRGVSATPPNLATLAAEKWGRFATLLTEANVYVADCGRRSRAREVPARFCEALRLLEQQRGSWGQAGDGWEVESVRALRLLAQYVRSGASPAGPDAAYLDGHRLRIGADAFSLTFRQRAVLGALVRLGASDKGQLETESGYSDAIRVLRDIVRKYPRLQQHITFPGRKGRGGYRTTIMQAE